MHIWFLYERSLIAVGILKGQEGYGLHRQRWLVRMFSVADSSSTKSTILC